MAHPKSAICRIVITSSIPSVVRSRTNIRDYLNINAPIRDNARDFSVTESTSVMASSCWVRRNHSATPQIRCDITVGGIRIEMGRQDHGGGGSPAPVEDVPKHRPGLAVERCRRLVQEQYLRVAQQDPGQHQALPDPAG